MHLPPYKNFPNIIGKNISLRQIQPSDIQDLIEISFYDGIQAQTLAQAAAMQEKINQDYQNGNSIHWGIEDNLTHKIVGTCGYYRGLDKGAGELGCVLLPAFRGQGLMTMAMQLAIDFGWNDIGLNRIWASTTKENFKAQKLLERLGFVLISELLEDELEYELQRKITI